MREVRVLEKFRQVYQHWKFTADEHKPIRAELFAPEKLIEQARILALAQEIRRGEPPNPELLKHFQRNSAFLHNAYASINAAVSSGDPIPPAEEWFIDNFHVIAEQLAGIKEDLPKKFYLELPALATGTMQGYPRAYETGLQLIAHTDSRLDAESLREYMRSYPSTYAGRLESRNIREYETAARHAVHSGHPEFIDCLLTMENLHVLSFSVCYFPLPRSERTRQRI